MPPLSFQQITELVVIGIILYGFIVIGITLIQLISHWRSKNGMENFQAVDLEK